MNTILKRVISLLLCVVMTVGYMPVNAFATENGETVTAETTEVTAEQTEAASEETEVPSESTESLAELSEVTDDSDEEEEETEKESEKEEKETEKESKKEEKETEKESKKEEKEAEKESKKEEKPGKPGKPEEATEPSTEATEPSTEPSTEATEPSTEATEPSTEPSTEATEPSTEATEPSTEPTSENPLMTLEIEDEADPVAAALEVRAGVEVSSTALEKAQAYIDALTINNTSNDPATVVGNFGTHFTWDNEKRESSKSYLFDWSYYNGVVFEGLEYLYEVTGKQEYKDYVEEYMSSMITADGTWASCTNNTSKQAAGYNSTHGADCYKTASLLMDLYEMTEDERYLTMAATLYADLDAAASKYSLPNAGNNYRHTWASDPSPDLWLDGLYMILPFRAEYAEHIGDTEELDLIVDRMQWVSDNMYNEAKRLFYHAADSATSNSGTYWLRSIGWYAAAIVDIMDSMTGDNLSAMQTQLKKLVDGMLLVQNSNNGMWLNNMAAAQSSTNPYETSGTALVCYAVMKAVNEGWLDDDYADMAILAFNGICNEKLSGTTLTDICFKGAPGDSNSTFYNNEGKGVGPFIMLYAEVLEYTDVKPEQPEQPTEPSEPTEPADQEITVEGTTEGETSVTMTVSGVSAPVEAAVLKDEDKTLLDAHEGIESYVAIDVTGTLAEGEKATFTVAIPEGWDADRVVGISVEDGAVKEITGNHADGYFTFTVDHFSAKGIGLTAKAVAGEDGWFEIPGESKTIFRLTNSLTNGKKYVIVSSDDEGEANAVKVTTSTSNWGGTSYNVGSTSVTVIADSEGNYIESPEESAQWNFISNNYLAYTVRYLRGRNNDGNVRITDDSDNTYTSWSYSATYGLRGGNGRYIGTDFDMVSQNTSDRVYIYVEEQIATESTYVRLSGELEQEYIASAGTAESTVLSKVKIQTSEDKSAITDVAVTEGTITWDKNFDGSTAGAYTATVTYQGVELGSFTVTVTTKKVTNIKVNGSVGYVPKNNNPATVVEDEAGNAVTVTVTYDDNTSETIDLTVNMLNVATPNVKGEYDGLIASYGDAKDESGFTLNVVDNPGENFPEYPEEGSVDVNKVIGDVSQFQNLGVAEVQLSTSGIPMKTYVDAVLTIDISNSMAWETNTGVKTYVSNNKLKEVMAAVKQFAAILLEPNEDGSASGNTITIVTFAGYDAEHWNGNGSYIDSVRTLVTATSNLDVVNAIADGTYFTAAEDIRIAYIPSNADQNVVANVIADEGSNRGDTNYDYGFWQTSQAVDAVKAATGNAENREIHVLFMTDGCASNYNDYYYRSNNVGYYYRPGTKQPYMYYAAGSGTDWTNYIQNTLIKNNNGNKYAVDVYGKVENMYAVGFDMKYGSFAGLSTWDNNVNWENVFNDIVGKSVVDEDGNGVIPVTQANDTETLTAFYTSLAHSIRQAATNAYFVDQMGAAFDLQLGNYITKFAGTTEQTTYALNPLPAVKVMTYNIYKKADIGKEVGGETVTQDMVGQRYGNPEVVETVVFSADGKKAFSSVDGYTSTTTTVNDVSVTDYTGTDIMNDGVICAENFWYNTTKDTKTITLPNGKTYDLPAETFYWNIGTISDKEFVMSYYVYLVNSAEGKAPAGTYPTNKYATLNYTNWIDNDVSQETQSPVLAWKSASVYYAFYLVDSAGNPVVNQATGEIGSFTDAVKVSNKVFYEEVSLNSQSGATSELKVTTTVVPPEYEIYDKSAIYTVTVDSGNTHSGWVIETEMEKNTTYVTDYHGTDSSNATEMKGNGYSYTSTTVWFAVVWEPQALPDSVVIDYGLPVDITVLSNDMFGSAGALTGIGLNVPTFSGTQKYGDTHDANFGTSLVKGENGLKYGSAKIEGSKVRYTPETMEMPGYDKFAYEASYKYKNAQSQAEETRYYYNTVTVIPATTIYYEDSFMGYESYTWDTAANKWGTFVPKDVDGDGDTDNSLWSVAGTTTNGVTQGEDRPGKYALADANNIYGYDGANLKMSTYSLGSAMKATVDYDNYAEASFTFYGTGFDVISMTDKTTGTIVVEVQKETNGTWKKFESYIVDTFYGYTKDDDGNWVVNSEPTESIYQVPVIKMADKPYAHYKVIIKPTYDATFDHVDPSNTTGSYDFYLDAIRIYDPANDGAADGAEDTTIENAYVADGEGWPSYIELRNKLINPDALADTNDGSFGNDDTNTVVTGLVFIDGVAEVGDAKISDYISYGPNNEVYLAPGQRVAFRLSDVTKPVQDTNEDGTPKVDVDGNPVYVQKSIVDSIHIGLRSADSQPASYTFTNIAADDSKGYVEGTYYNPRTKILDTTTDMYYDLTAWKDDIIVISNYNADTATTGSLVITNIKATYKENPNAVAVAGGDGADEGIMVTSLEDELPNNEVGVYMTPRAATLTLRALNKTAPEETEPEESVPETSVPEVTEPEEPTDPEVTEPEETEPEETQPDKEAEKIQKEIEKALKKAAKEAEKIAKELQKAAEKAAKALSKLFGSWF